MLLWLGWSNSFANDWTLLERHNKQYTVVSAIS